MIDWTEVEAARRRGKLGRMRPEDQELCDRAYKADSERYSKMSRRVVEEVTDEIRGRGF